MQVLLWVKIPYGGCHGIAAVIDDEWEKINDNECKKLKWYRNAKNKNDNTTLKIKMIMNKKN